MARYHYYRSRPRELRKNDHQSFNGMIDIVIEPQLYISVAHLDMSLIWSSFWRQTWMCQTLTTPRRDAKYINHMSPEDIVIILIICLCYYMIILVLLLLYYVSNVSMLYIYSIYIYMWQLSVTIFDNQASRWRQKRGCDLHRTSIHDAS